MIAFLLQKFVTLGFSRPIMPVVFLVYRKNLRLKPKKYKFRVFL